MDGLYKIDKFFPYKIKTQGRAYIQDSDLQIYIPNLKESTHFENANPFDKLLSYYHEVGIPSKMRNGGAKQEALRIAMEEAESTFNSMMEISKQLRQVCHELIQMKT